MRHFLNKSIKIIIVIGVFFVLGYFLWVRFIQKEINANQKVLDENWKMIAENAVKKYVGKKLILPYADSVNFNEYDYSTVCKLPIKVVIFVDADCSTCLLKIHFWNEFMQELKSAGYNKFQVIIYAYSSLEENLRYYMKSNWSHRWQFDKEKSFIGNNELYDRRLQTALLDAENKVLLIGDPLLNPKLRKLYIQVIKTVVQKL